jgi:hypothetical protein
MNQAQCPFLRREKALPLNCAVGRIITGATELLILERMFTFPKKTGTNKKKDRIAPRIS